MIEEWGLKHTPSSEICGKSSKFGKFGKGKGRFCATGYGGGGGIMRGTSEAKAANVVNIAVVAVENESFLSHLQRLVVV